MSHQPSIRTDIDEIVKVQRPIIPPDGPWILYDSKKKRRHTLIPVLVPDELKRAMGDSYKCFAYARWNTTLQWWTIIGPAPHQDW